MRFRLGCRLRWILGAVAVAIVIWLGASYAVAVKLTRRAQPQRDEPAAQLPWGTLESLRLSTSDRQELGAWFVEGRKDCPAALILHGNGANRGSCLDEAELAASTGCAVLLITLRAHGDSTGETNDFGFSARHDVLAAVDWLHEKSPDRPIVVWGQSLGSAAALFAAEALSNQIAGYILECPYRDLRTATRNRTRRYLPPILDQLAYSGFLVVAPAVIPNFDEISPLSAAAKVPATVPVLVLAGSADQRATPAEAKAIADAIGARAELVVFPDADHLALAIREPEKYRRVVTDFLSSCKSTRPPASVE